MTRRLAASISLSVFCFTTSHAGTKSPPAPELSQILKQAKDAADGGDDLALRVLIRQASRLRQTDDSFRQFRSLIHHRPGVGWDFVRNWDRLMRDTKSGPLQTSIDDKIAAADRLMSARQFAQARVSYEDAAKMLRSNGIEFGQENFFLYQTVLHSLARALYGQGDYLQSLMVYQWISLNYPLIRQVQFEKMWAASRANNFSLALGAIASQLSSYFSRFLEPETYLVQYYLYRRLCREKDLGQVAGSVQTYKAFIDSGGLTVEEWAKKDIETLNYLRLSQTPKTTSNRFGVAPAAREEEVANVQKFLNQRFQADLPRIKQEMQKVIAYLNLAAEAKPKDLPQAIRVTGIKTLLKGGGEMWPVQDAEDWIDEIGHHAFVGESQCQK